MKKIRFLYSTPYSIACGGQEIQAEQLIKHIRQLRPDWDVAFLDFSSEETPADIYHLVGNSEYMWGVIRFLNPNSRFFVSAIHGIRKDRSLQRTIKEWWAILSQKIGERTSFQNIQSILLRAEKVFALTDPSRDFLVSRYRLSPEKVDVVPNGVAAEFFDFPAGTETDVLVLGSIIQRKSALEVVRFAASDAGQGYTFHFVGGPLSNELDYYSKFEAQVAKCHNVKLYGNLSQDSVAFKEVFSRCGVLLQLSKAETQSLAALEALAAGRACVFLKKPYASLWPFSEWPSVTNFAPQSIHQAIQEAILKRSLMKTGVSILSWQDVASRVVSAYEGAV